MIFQKLNNGSEVTIVKNSHSKLAAIQVWIHAGSIQEDADQYGMAHLIEHMLFKGTSKRGVGEISREVEACGGDINAYTTFDRTVYYLTLDIEDLEKGVDILSDAVFESKFDAEELEREKEVVIEEIRRGLDSPSNQVGRKLFEHSYPRGAVGRPIIGYEEGVRGFTRDDLLRFYKRWYQPENVNVVVVGDFDEGDTLKLVERYFAAKPSDFQGRVGGPNDSFPSQSKVDVINADFKQPRLQVAFPGPDVNNRDAIYLDLAAYVLGVGDLSRLNVKVRDEKQLVTAIGASLYAPSFNGLFTISAFPLAENFLEAVKETAKTLEDFVCRNPITEDELLRAKAQLKMQRILEEETVEGIARNIGFSLTTDQGMHFENYYYEIINNATCEDIQSTINRYMKNSRFVIVGMLPEDTKISNADIEKAFSSHLNFQTSAAVPKKNKTERKNAQGEEIVGIDIQPGIRLVYRQRKQSELMSVTMASEGGTRGEDQENSGLYYCLSSLIAKSTRKAPYPAFTTKIENLGASLEGFSGKDSFGASLQGLSEHRSELFNFLAEAFIDPDFTEMHWNLTRQQIEQTIESENDQPSRIAIREMKDRLYGTHPYRMPTYGTLESVEKFNPNQLLAEFKRVRDQGGWVIGAVSPMAPDEFAKELGQVLSAWKPASGRATFSGSESSKNFLAKNETVRIEKDREQTHIVLGYKGLQWSDQDRESLDVLSSVLGGMGGRLFTRLRDQNSLAYTVAPMTAHGYHPGIFGCYIACATEKTDQALVQLEEELDKLCETSCSAEELDRAKRYILGNHESEYQQSDSQAMTMALMELFYLGADDFLKYRERIQKVDAASVQAVARRLFQKEHLVKVLVGRP